MKILFISNLVAGRLSNFSIPSIEAAKKLGFEFHFAANLSKMNKDIIKEEESKYEIKLHHIDFDRNPFRIKNYVAHKQLLKLMKENKFDVVHCNTPIGGILGRICANQGKVKKVIYTAHGFHFYKGAPKINNIIYKNVERLLARITDAIITINQEDFEAANKFKLRSNGKVYYVPGVGVNIDEYKSLTVNREKKREELGIPKDCKLIIMVGELIKRKNYEVAIKAIAGTEDNIHCIICGVGTEEERLKKLCKSLNIEDRIHFLGFRKDIIELLHVSDVFLFTTRQEGLPRALMEAMSVGVPCIVSKIRGNTDLIEDMRGGLLCNIDDIDCFSNSITRILDDVELSINMRNNNKEVIKKYSLKNVSKKISNIYKEVIN